MALEKTMTLGTKSGNYLRILTFHQNSLYGCTLVHLGLYANKKARLKDEFEYFRLPPMSVMGINHDKASLYNALKNLPEMEGYKDILED